jgi:hypothetical protein
MWEVFTMGIWSIDYRTGGREEFAELSLTKLAVPESECISSLITSK